MVAAGEHDLRTGVDQPDDGLGEQRDRVGGGHRAVVDVAGHQHRVDPLGADDLDEVVEVGAPGRRAAPPGGTTRPRCQSEVWIRRTLRTVWRRCDSTRDLRRRPGGRTWLAGLHTIRWSRCDHGRDWRPAMGETSQRRGYTREERQRYREKVRQNLDVFEQMLAAVAASTFERPMTGLEIELNLVDADLPAAHVQRRGAATHRRPGLPDRARRSTTSSSTSRRVRSPGDSALELEVDAARAASTAAEAPANEVGAHIVAIGILPTVMPEHFSAEWMSANTRYAALNEAVFAARGEDIYIDIEGPTGERLATYADSIAPESACTSVQLHLQVSPAGLRRRTGTPRRPSSAPQLALGANSPYFFGKRLLGRDPHRAVHPGHRHPLGRAEEPGRAAPGLLRRALDHLDLRPVRGERPLLPGAAAGDHRRGPGGGARGAATRPRLHELRLHNGTVYRWNRPIYDIVDGTPAPAGREPRAAGRPDHRRHRSPTRRSTTACMPDAGRARTARSGRR